MTCLNLWLSEDRALLAMDSALQATPQTDGLTATDCHVSKFLPLPHARIIVAGMGASLGLHCAMSSVISNRNIVDFKSARAQMPDILASYILQIPALVDAFAAHFDREALVAGLSQQEIILVGWSTQEDEPAAVIYRLADLATGFTSEDVAGDVLISPWDCDVLGPLPEDVSTLDAMEANIGRQIRYVARHKPELLGGFGGYMVTAEFTRDAITLRKRPLVGVG